MFKIKSLFACKVNKKIRDLMCTSGVFTNFIHNLLIMPRRVYILADYS